MAASSAAPNGTISASPNSTASAAPTEATTPLSPVMERTIIIVGAGAGLIVIASVVTVILFIINRRNQRRRSEIAMATTRDPRTKVTRFGNNYESCMQDVTKAPQQLHTATNAGVLFKTATKTSAVLSVDGCNRRFIELPTTTEPCPVDCNIVAPLQNASEPSKASQGTYPKVALRPPPNAIRAGKKLTSPVSPSASRVAAAAVAVATRRDERVTKGLPGINTSGNPPAASDAAALATAIQPLLIDCDGGDEPDDDTDDPDDEGNEDDYPGTNAKGYVDMSLSPLPSLLFRSPTQTAPDNRAGDFAGAAAAAAAAMWAKPCDTRSDGNLGSPGRDAAIGAIEDAAGCPPHWPGKEEHAIGDDDYTVDQGSGLASDSAAVTKRHDCDPESLGTSAAAKARNRSRISSDLSDTSADYENEVFQRCGITGEQSDIYHSQRHGRDDRSSRSSDGDIAGEDGEGEHDYCNSSETAAMYVNAPR